MRFFWTFFWCFGLAHMFTYVVGSIKTTPYNFTTGNILAVGITLFVLLISLILPKEPEEKML